jgi:hypothetical protein
MAAAQAHAARMCDALPQAMVPVQEVQAQFKAVASAVRSTKDTHVAACAFSLIAADAYPGTSPVVLVTRNTRDFKAAALAELGIVLMRPDIFLESLVVKAPREVAHALWRFRLDLASQPTALALLDRLEQDGLDRTAQRLRTLHRTQTVRL